MSQTLNDQDGLVNLHNLAQEVERIAGTPNKKIPIVFGRCYTMVSININNNVA
jgi:hypothetical protein